MLLTKSRFREHSKSHLDLRMQMRHEHVFQMLLRWIAPVYILFAVVDWISIPGSNLFFFVAVRTGAVVLSWWISTLTRGRMKYGLRNYLIVTPFIYLIEWIMIRHDLMTTPYFAGLALVMFSGTMLFPLPLKIAAINQSLAILPVLVFAVLQPPHPLHLQINLIMMTLGTAILSVINSMQSREELVRRFRATEEIARERGRRGLVIEEQVREILKRRVFESQFSVQVVQAVLENPELALQRLRKRIVTIVIDIKDSTAKATALEPGDYLSVVEDVVDVFAACCLKWNVTIDRFTGDGAQSFCGAPVGFSDDFARAIATCRETISMLRNEQHRLEDRWRGPLGVRFAVCEGEAAVGFIGKGAFKSYTAAGESISFTHRLVGISEPWTIAVYSWLDASRPFQVVPHFKQERRQITGLKGFGDHIFEIGVFTPEASVSEEGELGHCPVCGTYLVHEVSNSVYPKIVCPACARAGEQNTESRIRRLAAIRRAR